MGDSIDINALATPVGILPETDFGVCIEGRLVTGAHSTGSPTIVHNLLPYDKDHIVGQRIRIDGLYIHVVGDYNDATNTMTIVPTLQADLIGGEAIDIFFLPIQNDVQSVDWEEDHGRNVEGTVGGGPYKNLAYEGGKAGKVTVECLLGRDYYEYGGTLNKVSSLLAYFFTSDGKLNSGTGELTPRSDDADIATFSMCYRPKTGFSRWFKGCAVKRANPTYDNDLHAITKISFDLLFKEVVFDELPNGTLVSDISYSGYRVKTRGGVKMYFRYHTTITLLAAAAQKDVKVASVIGYAPDDWLTLLDPITLLTEESQIDTINTTTKVITMVGVLTNTYPAETSTLEHVHGGAHDTYNNPRIQKYDLTLDNSAEEIGDITSGLDTATTAFAGGSDYAGSVEFTRKDQEMLKMIKETNEVNNFGIEIHHFANMAPLSVTDLVIDMDCEKKDNPKEGMSNDYERKVDMLAFQISDIRSLFIRKV